MCLLLLHTSSIQVVGGHPSNEFPPNCVDNSASTGKGVLLEVLLSCNAVWCLVISILYNFRLPDSMEEVLIHPQPFIPLIYCHYYV